MIHCNCEIIDIPHFHVHTEDLESQIIEDNDTEELALISHEFFYTLYLICSNNV